MDRIRFRSACDVRAIREIGGRAASRVDHSYMCMRRVRVCICICTCVRVCIE